MSQVPSGRPAEVSGTDAVVVVDISQAATHSAGFLNRLMPSALQKRIAPFYLPVLTLSSTGYALYAVRYGTPGWLNAAFAIVAVPAVILLVFGVGLMVSGKDAIVRHWRRWPDTPNAVPGYGISLRQLMRRVEQFRMGLLRRVGTPPRRALAAWYRIMSIIVPLGLIAVWMGLQPDVYDKETRDTFLVFSVLTAAVYALTLLYLARKAAQPAFVYVEIVSRASLYRLVAIGLPLLAWGSAVEMVRLAGYLDPRSVVGDGLRVVHVAGGLAIVAALFVTSRLVVASVGKRFVAEELLSKYPQSQITLLRSFADDRTPIEVRDPIMFGETIRELPFEDELADMLRRYGPFVAIGNDDDKVFTFGASRVELKDDEWQPVVLRWMAASMMIVMIPGRTEGLRWEIENVIAGNHVPRLLVFFPPRSTGRFENAREEDRAARWAMMVECFAGTPWHRAAQAADISDAVAAHFSVDGRIVVIRKAQAVDWDYRLAIPFAIYGMLCHGRQASPAS
jgi:hypothetical protein